MLRGVARLSIAAMATALALTTPLVVSAASQPPHGAAHTRNLLARSAPGSINAALKPYQRGRRGIGAAVVAGVGPNIQVSPADNERYSTTASTYDPTNHSNLFAASNITTQAPIAGFTSTDSGLSWTMNSLPFPVSGPSKLAFYPGAAFNADGTLYSSLMSYDISGNTITSQIAVSKSDDKGKNWALPHIVEPAATNAEKPLIAVDTTSSPYRNRIYVGYDTNPVLGSEPLVVSHSDDGIAWTRTPVTDTGGDFGAAPVVGPSGEAYVAWDDWCASNGTNCTLPGHILLAKSTDGGMSWLSNGPSFSLVATTSIGFEANLPSWGASCGAPSVNPSPAPSVDVDRSGGVHNGSVYVAWGDQLPGGRMHIFYARSTDGGAHFSTPVQIDTGNSNDAWQPAVSVDQSNGAVTIAWYDRRDDPGNRFYRPYYTQSTDGGATLLTTQVAIASSASDPTLSCLATGDYMQMSAVDGIAHPFWSDTRNGRNQIFMATLDEATLAQNLLPPPSLFANAIHASVGGSTYTIAVGDFNNDGNPDLALGSALMAGSISVLLGKGDGTFGAPINAIPGLTGEMAAGDFNKDGKLDLAVTGSLNNGGYITGGLFIALGKGDGTFGTPASMPSGGAMGGRLALADFNKDGNADVVVAGMMSVAVLLGKGNGTFQPFVTYATSNSSTNSVAIADFNGDGYLDIAAANDTDTVSVLFGKGDGTFSAAVNYGAGPRPTAITVADFNGDGRPDIAVTDGLYTTFSVLINKGDGTFYPLVSYGSGSYTGWAIASGDFNHDGKTDLAVSSQSTVQGSFVKTWIGNGDGTFAAGGTDLAGTAGVEYVATDLNGDRRPDLVMADQQSNDVPILLGVTRSAVPQPGSLTFPDQVAKTAGAPRTVTITNAGNVDLRIAIAQVAGLSPQDFAKVGDTCSGATVPGGGSCTVSLKFAPKTVGIKAGALRLTDDAGGSPQLVPLTGKALIKNPRSESGAPAAPAGSSSVRGLPPPPLTPGPPPVRRGPQSLSGPPLPSATRGRFNQGPELTQPVRILRPLPS